MCLLIYKPADAIIPDRFLVNAERNNPHGSGIAFAMGDRIVMEKDPKWGAEEMIKCLERYKGHPAIVHFRYATHGSKNHENTHPFLLNADWVAAHNGIISDVKTEEDESDTRAFLRLNVIPMLLEGWRLDHEDVLKMLSDEMGTHNKMTFLHKDGTIAIANESSGHWKDGVWYSNSGYNSNYYCYSSYEDDENEWINEYHAAKEKAKSQMTSAGLYVPNKSESMLVLPDKTNGFLEKWHAMNTNTMQCDCCGEVVNGVFFFESTNNMTVCGRCTSFLPSSVGIPSIDYQVSTDVLENELAMDADQIEMNDFNTQTREEFASQPV